VTAKKREGDYLYNEKNSHEWQEICGSLREMFGDSAASGFLYWASEPLDNPDYEKFALDFAKICGRFPQTTTSIAHKDVERTRNLLKLSNQHGCRINRFSILSLNQFNNVMEAFTPEELLHCEIVAQNNESFFVQGSAGRARGSQKLRERMKKKTGTEVMAESPGTIACVSGFLINMVRRTVRLITPCPASDKWPNGYWVLDHGTFANAQEFATLLSSMVDRNLHADLRHDTPVRLIRDARIESSEDTITIRTPLCVTTFRGYPLAVHLAKAISDGSMTAGRIAVRIEDETGEPAAEIFAQLNNIFASGVLDEEPQNQADLG
jgi:radical SAM family RiPP maturation amino acid epimerase